jgi:hypothetical protein
LVVRQLSKHASDDSYEKEMNPASFSDKKLGQWGQPGFTYFEGF